jgi:hypothetical protein
MQKLTNRMKTNKLSVIHICLQCFRLMQVSKSLATQAFQECRHTPDKPVSYNADINADITGYLRRYTDISKTYLTGCPVI